MSVYPGLSKLRNAGTRRRVADPEGLQEEEYEPDFSATANSEPKPNLPTPTMEGGIAPESFDVRANEVINPQQEQQSEYYRNIGRQLGSLSQEENAETAAPAPEAPESAVAPPPTTAGIEQVPQQFGPKTRLEAGVGQEFKTALSGLGESIKAPFTRTSTLNEGIGTTLGKLGQGIKEFAVDRYNKTKLPADIQKIQEFKNRLLGEENAALEEQGIPPQTIEEEQNQADLANDRAMQEKIDIARQQPYKISVSGAVDEVARSPELQGEFTKITGENFDDETAAILKTYEDALAPYHEEINGVITNLTDAAERIRNRIESNQSTEMDKYYIGLSLVLPLLIGGFYGAEAGLATLGGTAQGLGNIEANRQKAITNDEELLADINEKRAAAIKEGANVRLKQAALPQEIQKNLPASPMAHFEGAKAIPYTDPDTGETSKAPEIANDLYVKPGLVRTTEEAKEKRQEAKALETVRGYVNDTDRLVGEAIDVVSQLPEKTIFKDLLINSLKGQTSKGILSKISQDVMINGRKENAGIILNTILGQLATKFAKFNSLGQLDAAAQRVYDSIVSNPEASFVSPRDAIDQLLTLSEGAQNDLISRANSQGFIPNKWADQFKKSRQKIYSGLTKKAENKEIEKRELKGQRESG